MMTTKEMIAKKEIRKKELSAKAKTSQDIVELRGINGELESINSDITELRNLVITKEEDTVGRSAKLPIETEIREVKVNNQFSPIATYGIGAVTTEKRGIDLAFEMPVGSEAEKSEMRTALFATPEYRTGYLKTLAGRTNITDVEKRALTTAAGSGGAAVPTTTYDLILNRMQQTSALFGIIKKSFIPGNVALPVANAQTAALWSDTAPGEDADDTLSQVSLSSFALSKFAKVKGQLLLMAIDAFEVYVVSAIADQLAIATESVILNGTGINQPTGILTGTTWDITNSATWAKGGKVDYDDLVGAKALLGLYRSNAIWVMNATMEAAVYKIKTNTNQPLFTQNPINGLIPDPLGFPIVVDYYMPDKTILLVNPDYYYMNINQNPTILTDDSAGFLSTSRMYRGTMFFDAKPALSAAFVKLTEAVV